MSQFFSQNQFAAQYFHTKYLHGSAQTTPTARSGWFRLMLADLQEEALKEDEQRKKGLAIAEQKSINTSTETLGEKNSEQRSIMVAKEKRTQSKAQDEHVEDAPPVRLKPMFRPAVVEWPDPSAVARDAVDDAEQWIKDFYKAATEYKFMIARLTERLERDVAQIKRKRKKRMLMMLMAAA